MKKTISAFLFIAAILFSASVNAQEKSDWKELNDFHAVMSKTFHPSEEGNLQPVKENSAQLVEKAKAWQQSTAPEGYDKKAVKGTLKELVKGSKELNKLVKANASDEALKKKIADLHEIFHHIVEKCKVGEEEHH